MVAVLEDSTGALVRQFSVASAGPHGLDAGSESRRAFVACDEGSVVALDLASGRELARTPIAGAPDAIWHNQRLGRLYVAIENPGLIEVVNTKTMTVEEQILTELGAHTTAFDALRQRLYVFLPSCRVAVYEESEVS